MCWKFDFCVWFKLDFSLHIKVIFLVANWKRIGFFSNKTGGFSEVFMRQRTINSTRESARMVHWSSFSSFVLDRHKSLVSKDNILGLNPN